MCNDIKIAEQKLKIKIRNQYLGLLAGLLISVFILKQEFYSVNETEVQKIEIVINHSPETNSETSQAAENKYINKFPEISGLAKMLLVTIHAPWIFNNQEAENNYEEETEINYSLKNLNTFFSRFSFPILKERSDLKSCENIPLT